MFISALGLRAENEVFGWDDATINGNPVKFTFDTGTGVSILLFSHAATRLGLKVTPLNYGSISNKMVFGTSEVCDLDLGITKVRTSLTVLEMPGYLNQLSSLDGTLGWPLLKNNIFALDAIKHSLKLCEVPTHTAGWTVLPLRTNLNVLGLEISNANSMNETILIDTGSPDGINLCPEAWRSWKATQTNPPTTINAYYTPMIGVVAAQESWAHEFVLGSLVLKEIPIGEANSADIALGASRQGTLSSDAWAHGIKTPGNNN